MTLKSRFYDLYASRHYDRELADITDAARARAVEILDIAPGATVLDLGSGTGLNLPHLVAAVGPSGQVIAVDASAKMLAQARERADAEGIADTVTFVHGDARQLGALVAEVTDDELDGLFVTLFLSVVPDWRAVFDDAFALVRPGGRCVLMDTYWPSPSWRQRWVSWRFAADPTRPGYEALKAGVDDFHNESFPPETDTFYIASGTKR